MSNFRTVTVFGDGAPYGIKCYAHWGGNQRLIEILHHLAKLGLPRLDHTAYFTRIAFWPIVSHHGGENGSGLSVTQDHGDLSFDLDKEIILHRGVIYPLNLSGIGDLITVLKDESLAEKALEGRSAR